MNTFPHNEQNKYYPSCKLKCGIKVQVNHNIFRKCECGQVILFAKTKKGKWMPIQKVAEDQLDTHFAYCPLANKRRRNSEKTP